MVFDDEGENSRDMNMESITDGGVGSPNLQGRSVEELCIVDGD